MDRSCFSNTHPYGCRSILNVLSINTYINLNGCILNAVLNKLSQFEYLVKPTPAQLDSAST